MPPPKWTLDSTLDSEDIKLFRSFLEHADIEHKRLKAEGTECSRCEVFAMMLWRRDHPKKGQIYPHR
jgi:hypothetical protein